MKRKLLISGIAVLAIIIGIYGAANSFFVNEGIYYTSLALIIAGLLTILITILNGFIDIYKKRKG